MRALVVTPTLGSSPWLDETVASVAALSGAQHVVVCPMAVGGELARRFPRARVVPETGNGMYAAINAGIAAASEWDVFTYLNDDDLLCAAGATAAGQLLERDLTAELVYGQVRLIDAKGSSLGWLPVAHRPDDLARLLARDVVPLAQPGTWLRAAAVKRLGGFDESYRIAGDLDMFSRALAAGMRFRYLPMEVASFRLHAGQLSKDEGVGDQERTRLLTRWKGAPAPASALWRFRRDNFSVYLDRIRRHGFVSMKELYRRG